VRRLLGDGWSIELPRLWIREPTSGDTTTWRAPGRTLRVAPGGQWRCADAADIIARLDAELPPDPAGKVGESGGHGVGHRAAWLYRHDGVVRYTLYGYHFADERYLETAFASADTTDLGWAFDAWRSVTRSAH
jgi:hypothetical protein